MDEERVTAVQDLLLRRLKEMPVGQLGDAAALRSLSVEIARTFRARKRRTGNGALATRSSAGLAPTFAEAAATYIDLHRDTWRNAKHGEQWGNTLRDYAFPTIGHLPVTDIDIELITKILDPIWTKKTETASRVRGRVERILDWATVRGYRSGPNPARWQGHLQMVFPSRFKVRKVRHHPALPFSEMPAFMSALKLMSSRGARALEFTILTASRSSEAAQAQWQEFDFDKAVWTVPANRMKAERPHRVPLSSQATTLLKRAAERNRTRWVFPGQGNRGAVTNMVMPMVLRRMLRDDITVHGFRSSFRDWASETTEYPREVAEAALAHVIGDKAEAAYRRGDLFEKRSSMMQAWANHCFPRACIDQSSLGKAISTSSPE